MSSLQYLPGAMNKRHHFSHYSGHGGLGIGSILCDVSNNVLLNSIPVFFS